MPKRQEGFRGTSQAGGIRRKHQAFPKRRHAHRRRFMFSYPLNANIADYIE